MLPIFTKQDVKDGVSGLSAAVLVGIGVIVVALVVGLVGIFGFGWLSNATANFRGQVSARNQINGNGTYRIAAYDHFFNLCQQVQSDEVAINNDKDALKSTTDPQQKIVLQTGILALQNQRADLITQYNVDSTKSYTLGQFKSSNLPYRLTLEGNNTCTA